jgi:hypothetical protein
MIENQTLQIGQNINSETEHGMHIDVLIKKTKEDKPLIFTYKYTMNGLKFKEWLESPPIKACRDGALALTIRGIQVVIEKDKPWDKACFSISTENRDNLSLPLLTQEIIFTIHRDLFSMEEWEISIVESQM